MSSPLSSLLGSVVFSGHRQHVTPKASDEGVPGSCFASIQKQSQNAHQFAVVRPLLPLAVFAGLHLNQGADGGPSARPRGPD